MTPLGAFSAGLQVISSWLISVHAVLEVLVSIIIGIVFVEFILVRAAIARAYTGKAHSSGHKISSGGDRSST
jgi:hypothetical protein